MAECMIHGILWYATSGNKFEIRNSSIMLFMAGGKQLEKEIGMHHNSPGQLFAKLFVIYMVGQKPPQMNKTSVDTKSV